MSARIEFRTRGELRTERMTYRSRGDDTEYFDCTGCSVYHA